MTLQKIFSRSKPSGFTACRSAKSPRPSPPGKRGKRGDQQRLYCGILHDIGKLVLLSYLPEKYLQAIRLAEEQKISLPMAEQAVFRQWPKHRRRLSHSPFGVLSVPFRPSAFHPTLERYRILVFQPQSWPFTPPISSTIKTALAGSSAKHSNSMSAISISSASTPRSADGQEICVEVMMAAKEVAAASIGRVPWELGFTRSPAVYRIRKRDLRRSSSLGIANWLLARDGNCRTLISWRSIPSCRSGEISTSIRPSFSARSMRPPPHSNRQYSNISTQSEAIFKSSCLSFGGLLHICAPPLG